ncbi:hypothetical protein VWZ88_10825 [Phaeobacter sp. JH20_36]|uniref:hypothetical protein n=1 Tax=Phaeobacter sp. JH20_31 TaxID=3112488 RepID=UPI003A840B14
MPQFDFLSTGKIFEMTFFLACPADPLLKVLKTKTKTAPPRIWAGAASLNLPARSGQYWCQKRSGKLI